MTHDRQRRSLQPANFTSQDEALSFFDSLAPVSPDCLISLWQGHGISTGHPGRGFGKPWAVMANGSASRMPAL
ncbi:hypothetical protein HGP14_24035 [Rhizobium sp. P32RR-XVIII]|nr:hypothetical protein [Rhizobium sp. P32RR-XVIII]